jgi:hypothetical protein
VWMWQLPPDSRDGPSYKLDLQPGGFTLAYPGASLRATFVSPKNPQLAHAKGRMKAHPLSGVDDADVNAVHVTGVGPTAGDFFVVLTLQKDAAPEVKVDGEGLEAKATVGAQTVRFEGRKIVVGP